MDWSKSKSIFIVVFLILNIFLYTQYVDVYTQSQKVEVLSKKTTEAMLKEDNITYITLQDTVEKVSYLSGNKRNFKENELPLSNSIDSKVVEDYIVNATFKEPIPLKDSLNASALQEFAKTHVYEGNKYLLWEIFEEQKYALFFQKINDRTLYYNSSGYLKVYWNDNNEIFAYEQTMLEKIEQLKQKNSIIPQIQVLQALYNRNLLEPDSQVIAMNLGYSTLVQLTQTQVFAPTWEVRVKDAEGQVEEYFVNAFEGKILEFEISSDVDVLEEEEE